MSQADPDRVRRRLQEAYPGDPSPLDHGWLVLWGIGAAFVLGAMIAGVVAVLAMQ